MSFCYQQESCGGCLFNLNSRMCGNSSEELQQNANCQPANK